MKRSKFSLSHYKLFSCHMAQLIPVACLEVLPGDSFQMATTALVRAAPLVRPVMHPVHVRVHHWYVPYRLVWDNFEKFITGGPDGMDVNTVPTRTDAGGVALSSLMDYLGIPPSVANSVYSALPIRAYQMIWNQFYRDQDLQTEAVVSTANGPDTTTATTLQSINWEKDYYTSARPWEQKGPAITIPIGTTAPVEGIGQVGTPTINAGVTNNRETINTVTYPFSAVVSNPSPNNLNVKMSSGTGATARPQIFANLAGASAVTVNVLREALALQRFEEARARYGSRYTEYLRYLGVRSSDARLQLPEYCGGGKQTIQWSEVMQTSPSSSPTDYVGQLKGHGIGAVRSNRFRRYFEEHGVILTLMSVRPRTMYGNGQVRMWNRTTKEDFWQKELQHIGQQEVYAREVYAAQTVPTQVFGYQDRYDEYRRQESSIAGEFRTSVNNSWHLARIFGSDVALNSSFVTSNPAETRIFAAGSTNDTLYVMANHSIQARRLVARTGASFIS